MQWNWVDIIILVVIGLSVLTGLFRGFIKELIALCVWVLAIWLAFHYSQSLDPWLQKYIQDPKARTIAAFVLILLATLIAGGLFNAILSFILRSSGLSGTDRLLGMGFGFARGIFIVALLILATQMTSIPHQQYTHDSQLYPKFSPIVSWIYGFMPDFIKQMNAFDKDEPVVNKPVVP